MSKAKRQKFLRKVQVFLKNNALALLIGFTTVLSLTIIAVSAAYNLNRNQIADNASQTNVEEYVPSVPSSTNEPVVFVGPLDTVEISKEYAADHLVEDKTTGIWQTHQAIDFAAKDGDQVKAVFAGEIEKIENSMMEGTIITLKISNDLKVVYKSLASETYVEIGDKVAAGDKLALAGTNVTEKAEGVHLHLEVWQDGKLVDPSDYFGFADK